MPDNAEEPDDLDPRIAEAVSRLPPDLRRFGRVFQDEIQPALRQREGERQRVAGIARKSTVGGILGGAVTAIGGYLASGWPQLIVVGGVVGIVIFAFGRAPLGRMKREAKTMIIGPIAERMSLAYTGDPGQVEGVYDLRRAGLLPNFDRSRYEDRLTGARDGVTFEFFEAHLEDRRTTHSNGRTQTRYVTVFRGQCLRLDFHKTFYGETLVTRDAGFFNRFIGREGMDRAILESPDFEKAFEVFTTDQVEARYLLTPDLMQRLVDLEETFHGKKLRCAFVANEMLIAVEGDNLFEPGSLFDPLDNPERIGSLLGDFAALFALIDSVRARREVEEDKRSEPAGRPAASAWNRFRGAG